MPDVRERLQQHQGRPDRQHALEERGDRHVPRPTARLHELDRGDGEAERAVEEQRQVDGSEPVADEVQPTPPEKFRQGGDTRSVNEAIWM